MPAPCVSLPAAGVIKACLRKDDFISSTYRDHVHALSKGVSARKVHRRHAPATPHRGSSCSSRSGSSCSSRSGSSSA